MQSRFAKATKFASKLRLALIGPAGTGKTFSALAIAKHLVPGGRVAVIDTERGSASKYADLFDFDVLNLDRHSPTDYVAAIRDAEQAGYDVVVIDSLSHAWSGKGGALEMVDQAAKRARTPNSFAAWREVTPLHNEMVDSMVSCNAHLIVTMRAKTEWVQEQDERGKTRIRKVGLAPVQRDGLEYEFDVVGDLDQEHSLLVTKTRCSSLAGALVSRPGAEFATTLRQWLQGAPAPAAAPVAQAPAEPKPALITATPADPEAVEVANLARRIADRCKAAGVKRDELFALMREQEITKQRLSECTLVELQQIEGAIEAHLAMTTPPATPATPPMDSVYPPSSRYAGD
jgi:hypothetical protein